MVHFSTPTETQPVQRGRWIAESFLCKDIPQLPIGEIPPRPMAANATMRDNLKIHSKDPSCWACHQMMDPLGLGLEALDHFGRHRTTEAGRPVDTSGVLAGAGPQDGPFEGAADLGKRLADSEVVHQCFVRHLFRYFAGRNEAAADACSLRLVHDAYRASDGDLVRAVAALFTSPSFLNRTAD
jgi:hypothetical protein